MFPTFISILDIQSWWEVPSIAHFCSLFRSAFNLLDFDIEDLEEALLTDGTEESSWLQDLIVRLLSGCLPNNEISTFNYQMFLRRLFRQKCQEHDQYNPFNTDIDFQLLPLRTKVDILHALCDFRLDADDVLDELKNLEADSLRVEPLGYDINKSAYWYFYGTRLYREDYTKKNNKKKAVWQVVCFTEDDWFQLTKKLKESTNKAERQLHHTLSENFLPELPRLFKEKENMARKRLLEKLPRRTSSRLKKTENELSEIQVKIDVKEKQKQDQESRENEVKRKKQELENRRQEAYERRSKLKQYSEEEEEEDEEENIEDESKNKRSKIRDKNKIKDELSSKEKERETRYNKKRVKKSGGEKKEMSSKPATIGRQTNNSLSAATGQILIEPVKHNNKKKLKTSQVYRQTDEDLQTGMHKILDFVKNHEDAWPFTDPVEEEYAPNYYSIIRKPMDLQRMEERLDSGYYKSFDRFRQDFLLIVDNCKLYNGAENEYTEMVDNLLQVFEKATEKYLDQISSSDDEIAIEFSTKDKDKNKTKNKSKKQEEPNVVKTLRKPMLVAQTDKKRERSLSEESLNRPQTPPIKNTKHRKHEINEKKKDVYEHKKKSEDKISSKKNKSKKGSKKAKKKKIRRSKSVSPSESLLSLPSSDSPPPSSPDSRFDFNPKSPKKRKQYEEFSNKDSKTTSQTDFYEDLDEIDQSLNKKVKKHETPTPLSTQSPPKDKHNKLLRETIEKLKAKSEIKVKNDFTFEIDHPKENKDKSPPPPTSSSNIKKKRTSSDSDIEIEKSSQPLSPPRINKPTSNMDALNIATEQTLKDINKWLDDTPKFAEFSSESNSPAYAGLEEFDPILSTKSDLINKKQITKPQSKDPLSNNKKKPFRDPSKFFKRKEIQRTIDRLQPGKSKGNLISNVQSSNNNTDEIFPLSKLKDNKNSLIVKTNTNAPKLSLGTVLDSFGQHKFVNDDEDKNKIEEHKEVEIPVKVIDNIDTNKDIEIVTDNDKKVDEDNNESQPQPDISNNEDSATPNLSAWFKAFGAPKIQTVNKKIDNNVKIDTDIDNKKIDIEQVPIIRQRRVSTGSSVSERSSFSQDMDSPRVGIDEYPAPYPSPLHGGASPIISSPRPDISPKTAYNTINGQIRVGFYQDIDKSNKSSPDKSCSPRENSHYSEHVYTPTTTTTTTYSETSYYSYYPNYSTTNPTPPYTNFYDNNTKSPNTVYSPHSPVVVLPPQSSPQPQPVQEIQDEIKNFPMKKRAYTNEPQLANQKFEIDARLNQKKPYIHQNIPDPKNMNLIEDDYHHNSKKQQQNKIDMSKYTNMGYTGPDLNSRTISQATSVSTTYDLSLQQIGYKGVDSVSGSNFDTTTSRTTEIGRSISDVVGRSITNLPTEIGRTMTNISSEIGRTITSISSDVSRSIPDVGRLSSDVSRSIPDVGRSIPDVSRSISDVGRLSSDVGRSITDVNRSITNLSTEMTRSMSNLSHIVDRFGNDERMLMGIQNSSYYGDKSHILNKPIFSQANVAAIQSYNQNLQNSYTRQITDLQNHQGMLQNELKSQQIIQEKKMKKRKSNKSSSNPVVPEVTVSQQQLHHQQQQPSTNQGFQSYAGLKSSTSLEPSAISLKTSSVVPGSAFNFGPTPTGLGLYSDSNFLEDFRTASPNYSRPHTHAHQNTNPQSYPFLGTAQPRPTYPFIPNAQAPLMDTSSPLYQHYVLNHQGLLPPGAYPPGYHPLSMRQPYDSINRPPPWL